MSYMRFVLDDGTVVELETESGPVPEGPQSPTMRGGGPAAAAQRSFQEAIGAIKKTVATAVTELRDAFPDRPDELEIEFGIKASVEANGLILAKAAGEASFTVKALWKKPGPPSESS
ncbi:MAG TPA: CU044_2847 family protein [Longimicrobium sp.]